MADKATELSQNIAGEFSGISAFEQLLKALGSLLPQQPSTPANAPLPRKDFNTGEIVYPDGRREKVPQPQSQTQPTPGPQSQSPINDILQFLGQRFQPLGQSAAASNQRMHNIAQQAQQPGGFQGDVSGLMGEMSDFVNPMAGILGPIRTAAQKKAASALFRADPELTKQIAASPRQMNLRTPTKVSTEDPLAFNYGTFRQINPGVGEVAIHPLAMRGKTPSGKIDPILADLPSTMLHEALHFMNYPDVVKKDPKVAETLAVLLSDFLPKAGKSQVVRELFDKRPIHAFNEALSWLGESAFVNRRAANRLSPDMLDNTLQRLSEVTRPKGTESSIMELIQQFSPQATKTKKMSDALKSAPALK